MNRPKQLVFLGCGAVAQCALQLMSQASDKWPQRITVLDQRDLSAAVASLRNDRLSFVQGQITPENYGSLLAERLEPGDLLVDLAWNIETCALLDWCRERRVCYVNTSLEFWDPDAAGSSWADRTLYVRHQTVRERIHRWGAHHGPTAVLEHGANPGLVSHFAHAALIDIAQRILVERSDDPRADDLHRALEQRAFAELAYRLGVRVIHIAEHDSQATSHSVCVDEFCNTWSVPGFYEECVAPAELGWGTHEQALPANGRLFDFGPQHQIYLQQRGMETWVRSWCPSGEFAGLVIRHGEAGTLSDRLTLRGPSGEVLYRPTVHYAYRPCPAARAALQALRHRGYRLPSREKVLRDEIESGCDELGCLLLGHDFGGWWIGSELDIATARQLVPHQNATVIQVAASLLAAVAWVLDHPDRGICLPEDLPHEPIIAAARPWLGRFRSQPVDWSPYSGSSERLGSQHDHTWQFAHFFCVSPVVTPQ